MTHTTIDQIRVALAQAQSRMKAHAQAERTTQINLLQHLVSLKEEHASDADLARTLVDCFDSSQAAYDWVRQARQDLGFMLDVLALQVAMEGKARAQRQAHHAQTQEA